MSSRVFLAAFLTRATAALLFSAAGFLGAGGDAEAIHTFGAYARDVVLAPTSASLEERAYNAGLTDIEGSYLGALTESVEPLKGAWTTGGDTTMPFVFLHAVVYALWDTPFAYVLLTSLLSAFATAYFAGAVAAAPRDNWWFILNPASIYFAATHHKEGLTEVGILLFSGGMHQTSYLPVLLGAGLVGAIRPSFLPFLGILWLGVLPVMQRLRPRLVVGLAFLVFALAPSAFIPELANPEGAGPVYSVVYSSQMATRVLGPAVGLLLPMPFAIPLSYGHWIAGTFLTLYGLFHLRILLPVGRFIVRAKGVGHQITRDLNPVIIIVLLLAYRFAGSSGLTERFVACFLPVLIAVFLRVRQDRAAVEPVGGLL